jgi:hypothetical protein
MKYLWHRAGIARIHGRATLSSKGEASDSQTTRQLRITSISSSKMIQKFQGNQVTQRQETSDSATRKFRYRCWSCVETIIKHLKEQDS